MDCCSEEAIGMPGILQIPRQATDATRTSFFQNCPICGRLLRTAVHFDDGGVRCQHCGGEFVASDPERRSHQGPVSNVQRAEQLLARCKAQPLSLDI